MAFLDRNTLLARIGPRSIEYTHIFISEDTYSQPTNLLTRVQEGEGEGERGRGMRRDFNNDRNRSNNNRNSNNSIKNKRLTAKGTVMIIVIIIIRRLLIRGRIAQIK